MACLGFTYGCFAGLPMAWPFGTIVGSNCGCDRHPVSSLDPLSIQRHRRVAFVFVKSAPEKFMKPPQRPFIRVGFWSPVSRAAPATRMIRGPVGLVSGWGCQIPVSFPSLWISRTGPSGPARNRMRETPNLPMILYLFHAFCGEWSTPLLGPDKPRILPPSAGRTYPHAAGAATRIKLLASP